MPRIRTIKPEFWSDEAISKLPMQARLLFIGTWNLADDYGICKGSTKLIKSQLFPYDDSIRVEQIGQWIEQLVKARMMIPFEFENESYLYIRSFNSHQKIDKPSKTGHFSVDKLVRMLKLTNTPRTFDEYAASIRLFLGVGKERKGKEQGKEQGGEDPPPQPIDPTVFYNAEEIVLGNALEFERICMAAKKFDAGAAKESLRKYHLYLEEKEKYPMSKKQLFAGFEKWLMNEKNFYNGNNQTNAGSGHAKSASGKDAGAIELANRLAGKVAERSG